MHRIRRTTRLLTLTALLLSLSIPAPAQSDFALRDGDTVVFYGDSITDQRLYTTFAETYVLTRFPDRKVRFIHSGWGGDRVTGGGGGPIDERLRRDVIAYRPTVVTVMLGMNDARYRAFDPQIFQDYSAGYEQLVQRLKQALPGVRLTLIQPSPFDDVTRPPQFDGGYNTVLTRYGQYLATLAQKEGAQIADLNTPVVAMLRNANQLDAVQAARIIPDRVHPGASGHLSMAAALLTAWRAPAVVTSVELRGSEVARQERTAVRDLQGGASGLTWTQQDQSLPFPIDSKDALLNLVVKASDFQTALNQQMLTVGGLSSARYALEIDGMPVGAFTREDLSRGINLAAYDTPMQRQAMSVHLLTLQHNNIRNARWRTVQVPLQGMALSGVPAVMDALERLEAELIERQRAAARPVLSHYKLTALPEAASVRQ